MPSGCLSRGAAAPGGGASAPVRPERGRVSGPGGYAIVQGTALAPRRGALPAREGKKITAPRAAHKKHLTLICIFFKLCILSLKSNTQLLLRLAVGTAFSGSLNHRSIENPARQKTSRYFA